MKDTWLVLLNPLAGGRRALLEWDPLATRLEQAGIPAEMRWTEAAGHASKLVQEGIAEGYRKFLAVGGDGTVHEVVNGLMQQEFVSSEELQLAVWPLGTGNDWVRTHRLPRRLFGLIQAMKNGHTRLQDVGKISYQTDQGPEVRYVNNVLGACYDAFVVQETQGKDKSGFKGTVLYLAQVLRGLWKYESPQLSIRGEGFSWEGKAILLLAGICQYNGGGMHLLPRAIPDDGLLDISVVEDLRPWQVVRHLAKLYNGRLYKHPRAHHFRSPWLEIEISPTAQIEADGELLGNAPARIELIPNALRIVVPAKR